MYTLNNSDEIIDSKTQFIHLLTTKWKKLHDETDVFRYKIYNIQERKEGKYLLQLNPDRSIKRRTPEQIDYICQPFDGNKFNFTKAPPEECLFTIETNANDTEVHAVLVNISPISKYHALLCPSIDKHLPQVVTADSLKLVLHIMFLAQDRDLKIGFNSLCALASVNHLHYHLFLEKYTLPIETVKYKHLKGNLYCTEDYPVPAFCFEVTNESINIITNDSYILLEYLLKNSVAHNILITRTPSIDCDQEVVKLIIWPRKSTSGVKQFTAFNVAVLELSGWFPMYSKEEYDNIRTGGLENELMKWKVDNFQELCDNIIELF